ncbi:MAG: hemolysin III family protein [Acidobacteriota bacterium]|nr:hemolysin III family protein [Acidobacteriota bacterium]MDH3528694.1 hemolysin III family protein [Acidobacteriota bacterium]
MKDRLSFYHPTEEKLNVLSHGFGLVLSLIGLLILLSHAISIGTVSHLLALGIYGASLVVLYAASTTYHLVQEPNLRYKLNIFDHSAIYGLIAGTYTPFALLFFKPELGWPILVGIWTIALAGILFKLFFTGKFNAVSTVLYVLMGWLGVLAIGPIIDRFPVSGVVWIFAGGIFYTLGAILYAIKQIKFNHAIFHVFVLLGSISHFISVIYYLIPDSLRSSV